MKINNFIGQTAAVAEANDIIQARDNAVKEGRPFKFRPILLKGLTGLGKTELGKCISNHIENMNHVSLPVGAGWTEAAKLAETIASFDEDKLRYSAIPHVITIDEAHAQKTLADLIKVWFDDNGGGDNIVSRNGHNYYYNPLEHLPIFCSNRTLDAALEGRCYKITLVPYNKAEKKRLIVKFGEDGGVTFDDEAIEIIESRVKPQAREIKDIVYPFTLFPGKFKGPQTLQKLLDKGFFPQGLRRLDLAILQEVGKLKVAKASVLKRVAQDDKKKDTEDKIDWLIAMELLHDVRGGYSLTKQGVEYLNKIGDAQKAAREARAKVAAVAAKTKTTKK